jgi:hypothetical protein
MKKAKKPRPAAPRLRPVNAGDLTLKLEPDANLRVTVLTPEKPQQPLARNMRLLISVFTVLFAMWVWLNWRYVIPTEYPPPLEFSGAPITVSLAHPTYVAFRDEAELELTVANRGSEDFTGNVTIIFQGNVPAGPLPQEMTTVKITDLVAGASHAHRLKFALRQQTRWFSSEAIRTRLQISSDARPVQSLDGPLINIAPVPLLQTINAWLKNSVVLAVVAALLWEVTRKRFLGWEAK